MNLNIIYIITIIFTCGLKLFFNMCKIQHVGYFNWNGRWTMETEFDHHSSQKLKSIRINEFNHLYSNNWIEQNSF